MAKFRSYYDGSTVEDGISFEGDPGYTKQEFQEECDINVIMRKYTQFGVVPEEPRIGQFGDFTSVPDLLEAQLIIQQSSDEFQRLPSQVRERFDNDPVKLMRFLEDGANRDEAVRLGLVNKPAEPAVTGPPPQSAGDAGNSATPK